jgi:hypothetical protein
LAVHEDIEGVVVELVDVVGGHRDVVDPDADGDGGDCDGGVEDLGYPEGHESVICVEGAVMQYFYAYGVSWSF